MATIEEKAQARADLIVDRICDHVRLNAACRICIAKALVKFAEEYDVMQGKRLVRAEQLLETTIADRDRLKHELQQALLKLEDAERRPPEVDG